MRSWLAVLLLALAPTLHAAVFRGTVTHVTDGDTLWVRPASGAALVEIRLLDIDAPESCQAWGAEAKAALRERVLHRAVRVRTRGVDKYHRRLARIELRGEDMGAWLVRDGHAWSSRFHGKAGRYAALEEQARRERRGLWAQSGAVEPRSFRQRHGRCP
jgi:endonuclease YncB( thermonuclease family)